MYEYTTLIKATLFCTARTFPLPQQHSNHSNLGKMKEYLTFCATHAPLQRPKRLRTNNVCRRNQINASAKAEQPAKISRRQVLINLAGIALASKLSPKLSALAATDTQTQAGESSSEPDQNRNSASSINGYLTKSGLKYFDFAIGEGPTPIWGDVVNIQYVAYTVSPSGDSLVKQDSSYDRGNDGYLIHHGNGEMILGLEEALHSMSVGGRRRCIIPRKLAYWKEGFAPIPDSERKRKTFSKALKENEGTVVFDIELRSIAKGDNYGYYSDLVPTEEEVMQMFKNTQQETVPEGALSITL